MNAIREALRYVNEYQNSKIVIKLGKEIVKNTEVLLKNIKDIQLLQGVGVDVFIAHSPHELMESELFGNIPLLAFDRAEDIPADEQIAKLAIELKATKLVYMTEHDGIFANSQLIRQATLQQTQKLLNTTGLITGGMRDKLKASMLACKGGVPRVHIISGFREGALLKELLSCDGIGTMIYKRASYQRIRHAKQTDTLEIVRVLGEQNFPTSVAIDGVARSLENILVFTVDGEIHGCAITTEYELISAMEIGYLSVSSSYEETDALQKLVRKVTKNAHKREIKYVFLDVSKNVTTLGIYPWFSDLGFKKYYHKEFPWQGEEVQAIKIWAKYV